jgi:hypothetical protein
VLATKTDESVWSDDARLGGWAWVECLEDIVGHAAVGTNKESMRLDREGQGRREGDRVS